MDNRKMQNVGSRLDETRFAALAWLAESAASTCGGVLGALSPTEGLGRVLLGEAGAGCGAAGLAKATERLVAEALAGRLERAGVIDDEGAEKLPRNPGFLFDLWLRYQRAEADRLRPTLTVPAMLAALRSPNPTQRLVGGLSLARSLGVGMALSGASDLDAEHGAGRDVSELIGKAISGDDEAVDRLELAITTDPTQAGQTPVEASPADLPGPVRGLAHNSPDDLIDAVQAELDDTRRLTLVQALFVSVGKRTDPARRPDTESLLKLSAGLSRGDGEAVEAARSWIASNLLTPAEGDHDAE